MTKKIFISLFCSLIVLYGSAQDETTTSEMNPILTLVPFLTISPDARGGALGDAGVATSPDPSSQYWNPSKYVFMENTAGFDIAFTPWLTSLGMSDINIVYFSGYYKFDDKQAASMGLRYFNLGTVDYTNLLGHDIGTGYPNEFAIDLAYSRMFGENFSGGLAFRYILSDIAGGQSTLNNIEINKGQSYAADISMYYQKPIQIQSYDAEMAFGMNISNIGSKMSYSEGAQKNFIPTNMKLGGRVTVDLDEYNSLGVSLDFNKLLVPTPPKWNLDNDSILSGYDDNVGTLTGIYRSFYDAPGVLDEDGLYSGKFIEELNEVMVSLGLEYWYRQQFAVRAGYFYESQNKGNRKYFSAGIGLKMNVFTLDFSYLIANSSNPLDKTMRFTLGFNF
ncbi:MAG: type IX secretion system outer membrane channel protein PorV [Bacteroidales bacterium]|nr:type IX secretion system outer membrane channel protein PorV [Bacteroidales bacterium]